MSDITVAIVTARQDEDTTYLRWKAFRDAILNGRNEWLEDGFLQASWPAGSQPKNVRGEFLALLAACLGGPTPSHHVIYQLRALALQTRPPDEVLIVSRQSWPDEVVQESALNTTWIEPMLSARELELTPEAAFAGHVPEMGRSVKHSFGCADKNTVLIHCQTEHLIMLDDCCLPGFGLVEAVLEQCDAGRVCFLPHRQMYLPTADRPHVEIGAANDDLKTGHLAFGILGSPLKHLLGINGWNTALDGQRGGLDVDLRLRMDFYAKMKGVEYANPKAATVYEVEHTYPWTEHQRADDPAPKGHRAPGSSLQSIRDKLQPWLKQAEEAEAQQEELQDAADRMVEFLHLDDEDD